MFDVYMGCCGNWLGAISNLPTVASYHHLELEPWLPKSKHEGKRLLSQYCRLHTHSLKMNLVIYSINSLYLRAIDICNPIILLLLFHATILFYSYSIQLLSFHYSYSMPPSCFCSYSILLLFQITILFLLLFHSTIPGHHLVFTPIPFYSYSRSPFRFYSYSIALFQATILFLLLFHSTPIPYLHFVFAPILLIQSFHDSTHPLHLLWETYILQDALIGLIGQCKYLQLLVLQQN